MEIDIILKKRKEKAEQTKFSKDSYLKKRNTNFCVMLLNKIQ